MFDFDKDFEDTKKKIEKAQRVAMTLAIAWNVFLCGAGVAILFAGYKLLVFYGVI